MFYMLCNAKIFYFTCVKFEFDDSSDINKLLIYVNTNVNKISCYNFAAIYPGLFVCGNCKSIIGIKKKV